MTYKNFDKIQELKNEFLELIKQENSQYCDDIDSFVDFMADKIIDLETKLTDALDHCDYLS